MDIHRLGLIDSLFRIIEREDSGHPDHVIAKYFLVNYARFANLNIYEVAAECYVSRSSIRRFCKRLGYDNFLDLKTAFKHFDYQYNYFMKLHENPNYRSDYTKEMVAMVHEVDELITSSVLEQITKRIHDSERVFFLSSYSSSQCLMEFQRPLVLLNKIVSIMTDTNMKVDVLESLTAQDAVFMISPTGNFARSTLSLLSSCKAYKAILTASHDDAFDHVFKDVYYLTRNDYTNIKSVRGKFGTIYVFDLLYYVYLKTYGQQT